MKTILMIIVALLTNYGYCQIQKVSGVVRQKETLAPLDGVTVQSRNQTVSTDSIGRFYIDAAINDTLKFSYVGMRPFSLKISSATNISVMLEAEGNDLNQVVVTGYQTQKKADLTGAVSVVNLDDVKDIPFGNPIKALQGRIPGVLINTSGAPNSSASVRIRGIGTLGNNDPLYVIDGIPTKRGLEELNPNDIQSIQVLKDASSASIYGSRAANGVIIVTTRQGKKGFSRINVNASSSLQFYTTKLDMLDTEQRGRAYWQASVNDRTNPNNNQIYQFDWNGDYNNPQLNTVKLPEFIDADKTMRPANTNWYDEIAQTSLLQFYNVAFSNGNERGNSMFSVSYYGNKGILKETFSDKITARFNTDYSFFKGRLKVGENLSANFIQNSLVNVGDVMFTALVQQPIVPVRTVSGGWGGPAPGISDRHNPVRLIEDNKQNKSNFYRLFGNAFADLAVLPNLHFRTSFGIDYAGNYQRTLRKSYVSGFLSDPSNLSQTAQSYDGNWVWQNTLSYDFKINKSRFDVLAGSERIEYFNQNFNASRQGYALENINYAYLDAGSSNLNNSGSGTNYSLLSWFGKINYAYDGKYLLSATVRRDGSSRFGSANKYGTFPAFSIGWRLSDENFIKNNVGFISDLKLRYGWGRNGNQEIANNATYGLYSAIYSSDHVFDIDRGTAYDMRGAGQGQLPSGFVRIQQGNDSLKWESTVQSNFGVDFALFNNSISGSVDYFVKNTSDILISPPYLAVIGEGGNRWFNGASMQNKGIEILLSYNTRLSKDFDFSITGNLATFRNKVTYLPGEVLTAYPGNGQDKTILGNPINSLFGYVADGLFRSRSEVDNSPAQPGKGLGRIRFKDLNKDNVIDDKDRDYIGNANPDFTYGLNVSLTWRKFDFSFFFQGLKGGSVVNNYKTYTDFSSITQGTNWGVRTLDAWTPQNLGSSIPALTIADRNNESRLSTYLIEPGSYLKLRNVQLAYNLANALRKIKVQNARVFIQGSNLLTFKNKGFTATDPENPNNAYPIPAIATVGIDLSF